ncbi:MAG: MBOAT family protein [Bacteroidia bacterium]|nr:MBOAT family protein [Bacteroidia bacterium]NNF32277.1 MBOAT family protein [Flavobacteriaceae bacterium]MBT8276919.1 MBOAT family protein [Bacteroidia bacterium]NNJ83300.1 MBOAT family protein [Flavobacteriaceae bacterium]NNK53764.1 MBOAT family protein [Flavobacteriaceae bacterium]
MLFNTIDFAIFLPVVLILYWAIARRSIQLRNVFLVIVSYVFYSFWDWRFLSLIFASSLLDYFVGRKLSVTKDKLMRKVWLGVSLFFNLGMLFTFKYFNFFVETFVDTFALFGTKFNYNSWQIVLPVGISFYTFQTLSYTIDIYRKRIGPTHDIVAFFAFVSFFPQLVAGPIERASNLLTQFETRRVFNYSRSVSGLRLILGGLFKKMVIADNCALFVNNIFEQYEVASGSTLLMGAVFFAFQIYGDFSGYSDIAIGSARLMGFDLMKNFNYPYLAQNMSDFWRRWHISLSTWFRDYVYIPLGGSLVSKARLTINILIVFLLSGLWHGANLTFVFWGLLHAIFVLPVLLFFKNKNVSFSKNKKLPTLKEFLNITGTFFVVVIAWVFFRAETITDAFEYLSIVFSSSLFTMPVVSRGALLLLLGYMVIEWIQRHQDHFMDITNLRNRFLRYIVYLVAVFCVFYYAGDVQPFIYFQF